MGTKGPLSVLYRDKKLLIVNKRSGMLVQGDFTGRSSIYQTAKDILLKEKNNTSPVFIGIVHRLDYPVSGIVILTLTQKYARSLSRQFRENKVQKEYYAVVSRNDRISFDPDMPIELYSYRKHHITVTLNKNEGPVKKMVLYIERLKSRHSISLLRIRPVTGRKHQIRSVLAYYNMPVIGDKKYGSRIPFMKDCIALHCQKVVFFHPGKAEYMSTISDFPDNWEAFNDLLNFDKDDESPPGLYSDLYI